MSHDFQLEKGTIVLGCWSQQSFTVLLYHARLKKVPHTSEFCEHVIGKYSDVLEKFDT